MVGDCLRSVREARLSARKLESFEKLDEKLPSGGFFIGWYLV